MYPGIGTAQRKYQITAGLAWNLQAHNGLDIPMENPPFSQYANTLKLTNSYI